MDRQIPPDTVSLQDYERRFHERVDPAIRAYIAGAAADGAFINYGITAETMAQSEARVCDGSTAAGRDPDEIEIWQSIGSRVLAIPALALLTTVDHVQ